MARGAITVPVHAPTWRPVESFMLRSTTGDVSVEQSAPLTMAVGEETVCAIAPHALEMGTAGAGTVGGAGAPPPPHAGVSAASTSVVQMRARMSVFDRLARRHSELPDVRVGRDPEDVLSVGQVVFRHP